MIIGLQIVPALIQRSTAQAVLVTAAVVVLGAERHGAMRDTAEPVSRASVGFDSRP